MQKKSSDYSKTYGGNYLHLPHTKRANRYLNTRIVKYKSCYLSLSQLFQVFPNYIFQVFTQEWFLY